MVKRVCFSLLLTAFLIACQNSPAPTRAVVMTTSTTRPILTLQSTATPAPPIAPSDTPEPTERPRPTQVDTPTPAPTTTPAQADTPTPSATPQPASRQVVVDADPGLNLRAEANTTSTVLRTLNSGERLTAIGAATAPDASGVTWQNVQTVDGQSGWVSAQYLADVQPEVAAATSAAATSAAATPVLPPPLPPNATPVVTPIAPPSYIYVAALEGLNLRADKSASSKLLTTLANGQRLQTNGLGFGPDDNGITWLNVKTDDNQVGWVSAGFVTDQVPSVATPAPAVNVAAAVAEILRRTNELRLQYNVPGVTLIDDLNNLALEHSQYMAQNGISHTGAGGLSAKQRITNAGYGAGRPTENIFGGQASIDDAWEFWSTDPPHLDVLLNAFNTVLGIGVYKSGYMTYYTMDFGKPAQ